MIKVTDSVKKISIGKEGENAFRKIVFDVSTWRNEYPEGKITAVFQRPDGMISSVLLKEDTPDRVIWEPTVAETYPGIGMLELHLTIGDVMGKSASFQTICEHSIPWVGTDAKPKVGTVLAWTQTGPAWIRSGTANQVELPVASENEVGGVLAEPADFNDTQPVRIGSDNKLYTAAASTNSTFSYEEANDKPSINGVELSGNKTANDLGIGTVTDEQVANAVETWLDAHPEATTTVADESITTSKLVDSAVNGYKLAGAVTKAQIFDRNEWEINGVANTYLNIKTGAETSGNTNYKATHYIPARANTLYTHNLYLRVSGAVCYNADKVFIGTATISNNQFTTLDETAYIRFSTSSVSQPTNMMICEGNCLFDEYYVGLRYGLPNLDFSETGINNTLSGEKLKNYTVDGTKLMVGSVSRNRIGVVYPDSIEGISFLNLFDAASYQTEITEGLNSHVDSERVLRGWLKENGTLATGSPQYTTILIPCKPNTEYSLYCIENGVATVWPFQGRIAFRDINKKIFGTFIPEGVTFTTPDGAYEIVCTTPSLSAPYADCQKLMVVYGSDTPAYTLHKTTPTWLQDNKQLAGLSVICYGDSLTQGKYPSKVGDILGVAITDAGIGGNTVEQIYNRIGTYGTNFDIVTIMCGTNDNGGNTSCPLGTADDEAATDDNATASDTSYAARLKRLLNKLKAIHRGATFVIMPPFQHSWGANTFEAVAELMKEISRQYKMPFLDVYHLCGWDGTDDEDAALFMTDQTHENDIGAQRIAELLAGFIKQLKGA